VGTKGRTSGLVVVSYKGVFAPFFHEKRESKLENDIR